MNLGATMTSNMEGQASTPPSSNQTEQAGQGQTYPPQTAPSNQQTGQGQAGPRVIRISHQAVPVVMMQMNTDGVLSHTHHRWNALLCMTSCRSAVQHLIESDSIFSALLPHQFLSSEVLHSI